MTDVLLKKSTKQHTDGWDDPIQVWTHMVLHLSHPEGGFGERQDLWLSKDDLQDPSSWSSSPLLLLRDIHSKLLSEYDCKEGCVSSQSQAHTGVSGRLSSQDGDAQQQETSPLFFPQLNTLHESSIVRGVDASNVVSIPT